MFSKTLVTLFVAAATVSGRAIPRATPPEGWWTEGLEPYDEYHTRYLALNCQDYHGQEFFDQCCHPLKVDETLDTARPSQCIPSSSASASASAAEPTSTVSTGDEGEGEDDCEEEDDEDDFTSSVSVATLIASTSTPATTAAPETTAAAETTQASSTKSKKTSTKTSSSTPAATSTSSGSGSGSGSSETFTGGFATYYTQNGVAGACGTVHSDSDFIAAIDADRYGNTGAVSSLCGSQVKITNTDNGNSVTVTIADACPTCENGNSIDLSEAAFQQLATLDTGMVPISWSFV